MKKNNSRSPLKGGLHPSASKGSGTMSGTLINFEQYLNRTMDKSRGRNNSKTKLNEDFAKSQESINKHNRSVYNSRNNLP